MWLNYINFDLKITRQGSVFIILSRNLEIMPLSMLKSAETGCRIWADIETPYFEKLWILVQNGHQQSFRVMTSSWGQLGSKQCKFRHLTSVKGLTPLLTSKLNEIGLIRSIRRLSFRIHVKTTKKNIPLKLKKRVF